jgi:glucosamine kinase
MHCRTLLHLEHAKEPCRPAISLVHRGAFILLTMAYYLGLDAGGTKTECALAEDDTILAHTAGGTIKTLRASLDEAGNNLDDLLKTISAQSGVCLGSITCTCIGLAGYTVPRIADWALQALRARIGGEILLAGDQEIALDAAFGSGPGVLVVAGTGSNIIGRSTAGQLVYVGGRGPVVADEGSGSWIGKQAVRSIFDALDRDETTLLLERVLDHWDLSNIGELIDLANQLPGPDFSKLTPLVVACAAQSDPYAGRVLQQAGNLLGMYAALASRRVQAIELQNTGTPEIAFTGSILRHIAAVRNSMCATLRRELCDVHIQAAAVESVRGALWRARRHSQDSQNAPIHFSMQ